MSITSHCGLSLGCPQRQNHLPTTPTYIMPALLKAFAGVLLGTRKPQEHVIMIIITAGLPAFASIPWHAGDRSVRSVLFWTHRDCKSERIGLMIAALFVLPPLRHDALSRLRLREVFSQEEGVVCRSKREHLYYIVTCAASWAIGVGLYCLLSLSPSLYLSYSG